MKVTLLLLLGLAGIWADPEDNPENRWVNNYDEPLYFECPNHQSISLIISNHDNKREDRVWDFSCKATFSEQKFCYWTGYVNDFDQEFTFTCASGAVLTGMDSYHDNKREDRRWQFLCCQGEVPVDRLCTWSGYVNQFDEYLRWDADPNYYLVGVSSYHDNSKEDRRWRYQSCMKS
uniref:Uncharacterized protein n=1 Tax=Xenopus tropicalis TaxID=8364 RepID=F7A0W1_XENTR